MKGSISPVGRYSLENQSAIRGMLSIVEDSKRHPEKFPRSLVNFGGGWPGEAPPEALRRTAMQLISDYRFFDKAAKYGETKGERDFFKAVANYELEVYGRELNEGEMICGTGSTDLTASFISAIVHEGSEVIITRPGYLGYQRQINGETQLKAKVKRWNMVRDGRFDPKLDELRELVTDRTSLIIITTPGNPDSQVFNDGLLEGAVDIAEEKRVWIMLDITYRAFCYAFFPKYFARKRRPNEIWMCTLSKEFRIPGWRVAYAVSDQDLVNTVQAVNQFRTMCPSRLAQELLTPVMMDRAKIGEIAEFNKAGREKYRQMGQTVLAGLREHASRIRPLEPMGGFFVFPDISDYTTDSVAASKDLLTDYQTLVTDGATFGMDGWFRLSFAPLINQSDTVIEGVKRIGQYLESRYPSFKSGKDA